MPAIFLAPSGGGGGDCNSAGKKRRERKEEREKGGKSLAGASSFEAIWREMTCKIRGVAFRPLHFDDTLNNNREKNSPRPR